MPRFTKKTMEKALAEMEKPRNELTVLSPTMYEHLKALYAKDGKAMPSCYVKSIPIPTK